MASFPFRALAREQVFAICAMRSIYTLVSHAISDLPYLKPAVALVLGFVGIKMLAEFFHFKIGTGVSLSVVSFSRHRRPAFGGRCAVGERERGA